MGTTTPNYDLFKPGSSDRVDVARDLAENLDKIDAHAHSGTYVASTGPVVVDATVAPYSADKTGVADARAAINSAIDAAYALGGGTVFLPAGTYKISTTPGIVLKAGVTLAGAGEATIISQAWWGEDFYSGVISTTGWTYSNSDAAVLSVNAAARATTLTCTSTASLTAGGYYILGDTHEYADSTDVDTGDNIRYRGEMVRVKTVDSGTVVTLYGVVRDTYTTANAASLKAVTYVAGIGLRDMRIVNSAPDAHIGGHVYFQFVKNFTIERVSLERTDGPGLHLDNCLDGTVTDCRGLDLTDNDAAGRYGYTVLVNRATENVVISGLKVRGGRHAFTTNGVNNRRGVPRNITVVGGVCNESNHTAWDTHTQGANISFVGCHATNGKASAGFNLRSPDTHIVGCSVSYCQTGIQMFFPAHGAQVRSCLIRHVEIALKLSGVEQATIDGNSFEATKFYAVELGGSGARNTISRNHIWNPGQSGVSAPGIRVITGATGTGNKIIDNFIGATGTANSEAGSTGLLQNPVEIVATGSLGYVIVGNRAFGALDTTFVLDSSTGATKVDNQFLETYVNPVLTNDSRLSDTRTPTDATVTDAKVSTTAGISGSKVYDVDQLTSGESTIRRHDVTVSINTGTGNLRVAYFTAKKTETITQVRITTGSTAAAATPTLVRVGVWTTDDTGALLSLVASTPNDTTLFSSITTAYTKSFSVSFSKVAGQRYAVGLLIVSGAATPNVAGCNFGGALQAADYGAAPMLASNNGGKADLPATLAAGSITSSNSQLYAALLP